MSNSTARAAAAVTLRLAREDDRRALRRLAELDSSTFPRAPVLVADVGGDLLAAVSTADGVTVADPFAPTADLVDLLRMRSLQLRATDERLATSVGRGRGSLAARAARLFGLLGAGETRRAAAYGMSGGQALIGECLSRGRRPDTPSER